MLSRSRNSIFRVSIVTVFFLPHPDCYRHLDPFGTTIQFLDGAFRNIYNGGVLVLTSTDIAALYGKCKEVLWRNYSARCARSDYTKEMAVRIVISAAAR